MSDDEAGGSEIADALADPYTHEQLREVLGTVCWRSEVPEVEIEKRVQGAAWLYLPYRQLIAEDGQPSVRERRFQKVQNRLQTAAATIRELPPSEQDYLKSASQDLAKNEGKLPDVEPERIGLPLLRGQTEPEFMNVWDAGRQIEETLERLDWLIRCVERAIERAGRQKAVHGSPVPDNPLHTTIRLLNKVYREYAADPRTPGQDIGDGSAESRIWRQSELLNFLQAALAPLGIKKSREAIYGDWKRATEASDERDTL